MVITEANLGWMSGVLDMHGHVIRKQNKMRARGSLQIAIYVEASVIEVVDKLSTMTGSSIEYMRPPPETPQERERKGCAEHCPEPHIHSVRFADFPQIKRWTVAGASCAVVLWNLRDHMVTRDEPWDWALAMSLASTRLSGQGSGAALSAIRRLRSLGWELPPLMRDVAPKDLESAVS